MKRLDHKVTKLKCTEKEVAYTNLVAIPLVRCHTGVSVRFWLQVMKNNTDRSREIEANYQLISFDVINLSTKNLSAKHAR